MVRSRAASGTVGRLGVFRYRDAPCLCLPVAEVVADPACPEFVEGSPVEGQASGKGVHRPRRSQLHWDSKHRGVNSSRKCASRSRLFRSGIRVPVQLGPTVARFRYREEKVPREALSRRVNTSVGMPTGPKPDECEPHREFGCRRPRELVRSSAFSVGAPGSGVHSHAGRTPGTPRWTCCCGSIPVPNARCLSRDEQDSRGNFAGGPEPCRRVETCTGIGKVTDKARDKVGERARLLGLSVSLHLFG